LSGVLAMADEGCTGPLALIQEKISPVPGVLWIEALAVSLLNWSVQV